MSIMISWAATDVDRQ